MSTTSNFDNTFKYNPSDCSKIFSIDYSLAELSAKWNADSRTIKRYLFHPDFLKPSLSGLPVSENYTGKQKTPLPTEVEPFLKSFVELARSSNKFKALFKDKKKQTSKESKSVLAEFFAKFYVNLSKTVCSPSENDDIDAAAFCRHTLFQNSAFDAIVMRQQWREQVQLRITQIQKLSQQVAPEKQAKILQDCLIALDKACLELIRADKIDPVPSTTSIPTPNSLLKDLLAERRNSYCNDGKYKLRNVPMPDGVSKKAKNLKEAFEHLNCTKVPDHELMKQARSCYNRDLAITIECSAFEKSYLDLLGYLDFSKIELDKTQLTQRISAVMKQVCIPSICRCCNYTIDNLNPQKQKSTISPSYFDAFLTSESRTRIQKATAQFDNTISLISIVTELRNHYENLYAHHNERSEDQWKSTQDSLKQIADEYIFKPFPAWFVQMWAYVYQEKVEFKDIELGYREQTVSWIVSKWPDFLKDGEKAITYLGHDASIVVNSNKIAYSRFANFEVMSMLNRVCETFIKGICLTFQRLIENLAPQVAQEVAFFQRYQQKERTPKKN